MNIRNASRLDLIRLTSMEGGPHLSIYLPAPVAIADAAQDRIRIKNLSRSAHETLVQHWMSDVDAREFLEPLETLAHDGDLQTSRRHGHAIFLCTDFLETYRVDGNTEEQIAVGRTFRVRPLLPEIEHLRSYAVLTLSQKHAALFAGTPHVLSRVEPDGWPEGFEQQRHAFAADRGQQVHAAATHLKGKQGAVFHGQGGRADREKMDLENYLKQVDQVVCCYLHDRSDTPLVLSGVQSLTSTYRSVTQYGAPLDETLQGNVDHLDEDELRQRVMPIVDAEYARIRDHVAMMIRERDCPVATNQEQILVAAASGNIDVLFFNKEANLFGFFDAGSGVLKRLNREPSGAPGDASHDLIEFAAVQTLKTGGTVYAVTAQEMPVNKPMAAALRF
jgi:hypothetical protein